MLFKEVSQTYTLFWRNYMPHFYELSERISYITQLLKETLENYTSFFHMISQITFILRFHMTLLHLKALKQV